MPVSAAKRAVVDDFDERIRQILADHGRLGIDVDTISDRDDLYSAGLTSHANVNVMLALESAFDVEFPDELLKRGTFGSISSIRKALTSLMTSS